MNFSIYLKFLLISISLALLLIATLNYNIDPAGIYHKTSITPERYASELIKSKYGLLSLEGMFSERELAKELSAYSKDVDCIIIGSSHVMQISSFRENRSLSDLCPSILNLGVSGASIEDHITLSFLVINSGFSKNIILGIDPWTLTYNKDRRWLLYKDSYRQAQSSILNEKIKLDNFNPSIINNLLSLEYTGRSIALLSKYITTGIPTITEAPYFNYSTGLSESVYLPDASLIYSEEYISKSNKSNLSNNIGVSDTYKVGGPVTSKKAVSDYKKLLNWISSNNAKPHIILTPYHPTAWSKKGTNIDSAMRKTEKAVIKIGKELSIPIMGSYDPRKTNCSKNEFYDVMHAKDTCLTKIITH
jgi:hypothetical protein